MWIICLSSLYFEFKARLLRCILSEHILFMLKTLLFDINYKLLTGIIIFCQRLSLYVIAQLLISKTLNYKDWIIFTLPVVLVFDCVNDFRSYNSLQVICLWCWRLVVIISFLETLFLTCSWYSFSTWSSWLELLLHTFRRFWVINFYPVKFEFSLHYFSFFSI